MNIYSLYELIFINMHKIVNFALYSMFLGGCFFSIFSHDCCLNKNSVVYDA